MCLHLQLHSNIRPRGVDRDGLTLTLPLSLLGMKLNTYLVIGFYSPRLGGFDCLYLNRTN